MSKYTERTGWLGGFILTIGIGMIQVATTMAQETKPETEATSNKKATQPTTDKKTPPMVEPALRGYCPAAYILHGKAMKGDAKFQVRYQASTYYLSSEEAKSKFEDGPEKFLPQFGGLCTTALGGSYGNRIESDPEVFDVRDGKVFLFSSERAKRAYDKLPPRFILGGERVFAELALQGICPVALQTQSHTVRGNKSLIVVYKGWQYSLSDGEAKLQFERDPEKFLPQYRGLCAEGMTRGKEYAGELTSFFVKGGRTFLFFDGKARTKFVAYADEAIKAADKHWKVIADRK